MFATMTMLAGTENGPALRQSTLGVFCVIRGAITPPFLAGLLLAPFPGHHAVKSIFLGDFHDHRALLERSSHGRHFPFLFVVERR